MSFTSCRAGLVAIALLTIAPLHSQTTFASITGIVTDSTGSVVPSAQVVATNVETNIAVQSASNESGNYTIAQLQLGSYTVRVNAPGFKAFVFSRFRRTFCRPAAAAAPFVLPAAAETNRTGRSTELRWPTAWTIRRLVPC